GAWSTSRRRAARCAGSRRSRSRRGCGARCTGTGPSGSGWARTRPDRHSPPAGERPAITRCSREVPMSTPRPSPTQVLDASTHHEAFLAHNLATRDPDQARAMLAHERRYIDALLPGLPGKRVLDLACGSGVHSLVWAEAGAEVTGIDFDRALLVL